MAKLLLEDIPERLFLELQQKAMKEGNMMNHQVLHFIKLGLIESELNKERRKQVLEKIKSEREKWKDWSSFDVVKAIREDRDS